MANEKNLGFAQGNNRGYQYAREELGSDYIIIMNNDLCIKQKDFIQKTEKLLGRGFDVIGPDVVNTKTNKHQNPLAPANYRKLLEKGKSKLSSYLRPNGRFLFKVDCFKTSCKSIVKKLIKDSRGEFCSGNEYLEEQTTLPLHGSCIIFGNDFVKNEQYTFDLHTFLYLEEHLLFQYCKRHGYKMLYSPQLHVLHDAHASTYSVEADPFDRQLKRLNYEIDSLEILVSYMERTNK